MLAPAGDAGGAAGELLRGRGLTAERIRRAIPPAVAAAALGYTHARRLLAPAVLDDVARAWTR